MIMLINNNNNMICHKIKIINNTHRAKVIKVLDYMLL